MLCGQQGTRIVLILFVTLATGAVVGRWSVVLVTVLVVAMVLTATLRPRDPEVAYSCDASVDPGGHQFSSTPWLRRVVFAVGDASEQMAI